MSKYPFGCLPNGRMPTGRNGLPPLSEFVVIEHKPVCSVPEFSVEMLMIARYQVIPSFDYDGKYMWWNEGNPAEFGYADTEAEAWQEAYKHFVENFGKE